MNNVYGKPMAMKDSEASCGAAVISVITILINLVTNPVSTLFTLVINLPGRRSRDQADYQ